MQRKQRRILVMSHFSCIALIGRANTPGLGETLTAIGQWLAARSIDVLVEQETADGLGVAGFEAAALESLARRADAAVVVGGDGTLLGAGRVLAPHGVPILGINHGRLGFMTDVALANWQEALEALLDGKCEIEHRAKLRARVMRGGREVFNAPALNDVVVSRGATGGMIELLVKVDGELMYRQRADGLIVATPTGSTAYALSANGPILHPSLAGLTLVPVAPQTLSNRPIALPDDCVIDIELTGGREMAVHCDMQSFSELALGDIVRVAKGPHHFTLLHPPGYDYFATLRQKLNWNLIPA
jgi:NAD+ kinase